MRPLVLLACAIALIAGCDDKEPAPRPPAPSNAIPQTSAGPDRVVAEGALVTLDGSATFDEDGDSLTYLWTQTAGRAVVLSGADTQVASFTAPTLTGNTDTITLVFTLTATDPDGAFSTDQVLVSVFDTNERPVARIDGAHSGNALTDVSLVAQSCDPDTLECVPAEDPDGSIASYAWSQLEGGPTATLANGDQTDATITLPDVTAPTVLTFQLAVTDNEGKVGIATHLIEVRPVAASLRIVGLDEDSELVVGGQWPAFRVEVLNAADAVITGGAPSRLTIRIAVTAGGILSGSNETIAFAGVADFEDLSYDTVQADLPVTASDVGGALQATTTVTVLPLLPGAVGATSASVRIDAIDVTTTEMVMGGWYSTSSTDLHFALNAASAPASSESRSADGFVASYSDTGALQWASTIAADGGTAGVVALARNGSTGDLVGLARATGQPRFVEWPGASVATTPGGSDLLLFGLSATDGSVAWTTTLGGSDSDVPAALALDDSDNPIVGGSFFGTGVDLDPCSATQSLVDSAGNSDAFVVALDSAVLAANDDCANDAVARLWSYTAGGTGADAVSALAYDAATDAVFVTGVFVGTVDFGGASPLTSVSGADRSGFLVRLAAADGTVDWAVAFGGDTGSTLPVGVVLDGDGDVWVAGQFAGSGDFDPGAPEATLTATGSTDGFVSTFTTAGTLSRAASWGGASSRVDVTAVAAGPGSGDPVLIAGGHIGTVNFDLDSGTEERLTASGTQGAFLMAVDATGALGWVRGIGSADGSASRDALQTAVATVDDGGLVIVAAGQMEGPGVAIDIDPSDAVRLHEGAGSRDAVIGLLDATGAAP